MYTKNIYKNILINNRCQFKKNTYAYFNNTILMNDIISKYMYLYVT